jgi:hypothetical protein
VSLLSRFKRGCPPTIQIVGSSAQLKIQLQA